MSTAVLDRTSRPTADPMPTLPRFVRRARELTVPVALGVGAVVILAASSMHDEGQDDDETFVRLISGHINRWVLVHLLVTLGWLLLVVGAGALDPPHARTRPSSRSWSRRRCSSWVRSRWAFENLSHGILAYALNGRPDVDLHTATQIQLDYFELSWTRSIVMLQACALLAMVVMGIGAIRSRLVPTWAGVVLCVSLFPLFMAPEGPVGLLAGLPLMVGLAALARSAA